MSNVRIYCVVKEHLKDWF